MTASAAPAVFAPFAATDAARYSLASSREVHRHAANLDQWQQRYEQLSAGGFEGRFEELRIGPLQIFREHANQTLLQSGSARSDTLTIGMLHGARGASWYCGHRLDEGRALVASDGDFELVTGADGTTSAVCVDLAHLEQLACAVHGPGLPLRRPRHGVLDAANFDHDGFLRLIDSALAQARAQPAVRTPSPAADMLALSLSEAVLDAIAPEHGEVSLPASAAARRHIVARARDYMQAHADTPIAVPALCAAVGVSRRALQYAFEDVVRLSPVTYLRVMRLNRVRGELVERNDQSLGDIAARWGFWHLSRFAQDYRQLFGELPSVTRSRYAAAAARHH